MAVITATVTDLGIDALVQAWSGDNTTAPTLASIDGFKVGEGGWEETPAGVVTRDPDPTLADLDVIANPSRYPTDRRGTFAKSLAWGTEVFQPEPGLIVCNCLVDFAEFNDNGDGLFPECYEIGLFSDEPGGVGRIMVAYGTFAKQDKSPAVRLPNVVQIRIQIAS